MFLDFSIGATRYSGVNRTFQLLYRAVLEISVTTVSSDDTNKPYFKEDVLEDYVDRYLANNLPRYVHHYEISYYYFYKDDGRICIDHECDAFKISLKADIAGFFSYEKAKTFSIINGKLNNE